MNVSKQITVPLCDLICCCNIPSRARTSLFKWVRVCVMLVVPLHRGATLVASLSSLLEAMSGDVFLLFVSLYCFRVLSIPSYRRGSE